MITAVLIKYKRIKELDEIIEYIKQFPEINEIIIRDNTIDNIFTYGRYVEAKKAQNNIIYTQDDDCIVEHIPELIKNFDGTHLVNTLREGHSKEKQYQGAETLVGWGAIFKKEWISVFDDYIKKHGEDYLLYRGGDRIFTTLLGKIIPRNTIVKDGYQFPACCKKDIALSMRKDYQEIILEIRKRLKKL